MSEAAPLILTALMERAAFLRFDRLRKLHFPAERNFIPAHITLFHHLPGPRLRQIEMDLADEARHETRAAARAVRVQMLGRGVAFALDAPQVGEFRWRLAQRWANDLVPQDRQGWRPHVTVQNKADPAEAKALHAELSEGFSPFTFDIEGVSLWWYRGGPWEKVRDVRFPRS